MTIFYPSKDLERASDELKYQEIACAMQLQKTGEYSTERLLKAHDAVIRLLSVELKL